MSDTWPDTDWPPTTTTTIADEDDGWGESAANTSGQTNETNRYAFDSSRGMGRGMGRAKRMNDWKESANAKNDQWSDCTSDYSNRSRNTRPFNDSSYGSESKRRIQISSSCVGKVIGRGGETIKDLQSRSGARINIIKDGNNSYETDVELCGTTEQIDSAQKLIADLTSSNSYRSNSNQSYSFNSSANNTVSQSNTTSAASGGDDEIIDWGAAIAESEEATRKKWESLAPINKEFYFEDKVVRSMDPDLVDEFRRDNNNIMVSHFKEDDPRPIPNPVVTFEQAFQHYPEIMREIRNNKFEKPSPIQCQSWPILLSGYDLIGIAQTGTGKTLAYLLPALIHIDNQPTKREDRPGPTALIIAPTRELAQQIERECNKYNYRGIKCVCIYGGGDRKLQISSVERGVEIVIATPGRLNDLCMNRYIDLSAVSYLVLDEADRMLDMGFEPQIKKIMLDIRPQRHTVMMSATWPPGVRRLAVTYMRDPMQIFVGSLDLNAVQTVTQKIVMTKTEEKRSLMYEFIAKMESNHKVIIFVGKKAVADDIASDCVLKGIDCQSIHGDRDQHDREQALEDIRSGAVNILIATDVASRGLDIDDITHIFNFDFPRNIEEYVHRVGRTGRANRTGESITLVTREDWKFAKELIEILERGQQEVPKELAQMADRYVVWKAKRDAEDAAAGGRRGGRGGGGQRWR